MVIWPTIAPAQDPNPEVARKPGEGIICLWALLSTAAEVGRRCPGKQEPAFQTELENSVGMIDHYVMDNGKIDDEGVRAFKQKQAGGDSDIAQLCSADTLGLYDSIRAQGATALAGTVKEAVSRPGTPTWGDCP